MSIHHLYMQRCLQIAKNAIGTARPNPAVGCVIVLNGKIIGEGFTSPYGGNHAEVNAILSVKNPLLLKKATLYVTLEPCSHFGKTPPCADLIVKHQIKKVIIGCIDTNPLVSGAGIEKLKHAGCEVITGVLETECLQHHKRFFSVQRKKRPYIILKWAATSNGFIAPITKEQKSPVWISNLYAQQLVHKWRSEEHAILVGTNTVLEDNPRLTVRNWGGRSPIRIVLDKRKSIPYASNVFDKNAKTIVICDHNAAKQTLSLQQENLSENILFESVDFSTNRALEICKILQKHRIKSIIIEGGRQTLQTFIDADLWDEARVFTASLSFENGVKAPKFSHQKMIDEQCIKNDNLKIYKND